MRNYIILNGNNSTNIPGLLIQELPAITKPRIRTQVEEIDGRDGDIVTKLGYSAYDKTVKIGLYGDFDIDEVIAFFNSEGTVVFSNEEDKYYNYQIVDQIDFERLVRYRTADVTFHCQPFKYSTTEEKIQIDATEVSGSGSNITLNNTENGALFTSLQINGDTSQTTYNGYNLLPISSLANTTSSGITFTNNNDGSYTFNGTASTYVTFDLFTNLSFDGNYTYVLKDTAISGFALYLQNSSGGAGSATTYITKNNNVTKIIIGIQPGTVLSNLTVKPYVYSGNYDSSKTYEPYVGGIPSPNPSYPQDVHVVTGENTVTIKGRNLLPFPYDDTTKTQDGVTWTLNSDGTVTVNGTNGANNSKYFNFCYSTGMFLNAGTYTASFGSSSNVRGTIAKKSNNSTIVALQKNTSSVTFTLAEDTIITFVAALNSGDGVTNVTISPMIVKGSYTSSTIGNYEPYQSQTKTINLGTMELCKIGNYQDYIYKSSGKWYKHSDIGKVVANGNEDWKINYTGTANWFYYFNDDNVTILNQDSSTYSICDHCTWASVGSATTTQGYFIVKNSHQIRIRYGTEDTVPNYKTWLASNPITFYYVLNTATDTEITDETLLAQLEALASATTYLGQTNIITSGSDLAPLLDVTTYAVENPSFTITNSGNIYSKPIITVYGLGTVALYLNGIQELSLNMGETTSQITIDVANMEAYNQDGTLMNRSVTGNYNNLSLNVGNNVITESGTLQGIEVENYSRWL